MAPKNKHRAKITKANGRPSKYTEKTADQAYRLCLLGYTDIELAKFFEIAESTLNRWKHDYPEFWECLKNGRENADAEVARSLYQRARGYSHREDKVFCQNGEIIVHETVKHYPPDTQAAIFLLKNRQPDKWKDKTEQDINLTTDIAEIARKARERADAE